MFTPALLILACAKNPEPQPVELSTVYEPESPEVWSPPADRVEPQPEPAPVVANADRNDPPQVHAIAHLASDGSTSMTGVVAFTQSGDTVYASVNLLGATPGEHFLRVLDSGSCASNPHGDQEELGTLTVGRNGAGHADFTFNRPDLADGDNALLGRAIVVDDGKACGIVSMPSS